MGRILKVAGKIAALGMMTVLICLEGCTDPGTVTLSDNNLTAGGATVLYAVQTGLNVVVKFSLSGTSASRTPAATITAPASTTFTCVATDSAGNLYVGAALTNVGGTQGEILVYAPTANGAATPTRTILGGTINTGTTFAIPTSININSAATLAILSTTVDGPEVLTMPASASGAVTPSTKLQGVATQFSMLQSLTIDSTGKVYVANYNTGVGSILIFAAGATGATAPVKVIYSILAGAAGLDVDSSGNVYAALDVAGTAGPVVAVYASNGNGGSPTSSAQPARTISGTATGFDVLGGLRLDAVGNIYVLNQTLTGYSYDGFTQSSMGGAPPLSFTSPATNVPANEIAVY